MGGRHIVEHVHVLSCTTHRFILRRRRRQLGRPEIEIAPIGAYRNWDFPKGLVEAGEEPIEAAVREVREETTLDDISFDWGLAYMDTGPYNKGKISRYYIARSKETQVRLPVNPELGVPRTTKRAGWITKRP